MAKIRFDSFGIYHLGRVAAELPHGHGVIAYHKLICSLMCEHDLNGFPKPSPSESTGTGAYVARRTLGVAEILDWIGSERIRGPRDDNLDA